MASSLGSTDSSSIINPMVTSEEFKIFHSIDRILYTRLLVNLGRDPAESMQVMALWIWLEREAHDDLVDKMLSYPDTIINSLADEALLCLSCVGNDQFHSSLDSFNNHELPLTQQLTNTGISLRFFRDNRLSILRAVTRITNEVCARAIGDIFQQVMENKHVDGRGQEGKPLSSCGPVINPVLYYKSGSAGDVHGQMRMSPQYTGPNMNIGGQSGVMYGFDPYDLAIQRQMLNSENIAEGLSRIRIAAADYQEDQNVPADNRTIFLTFSKGYPISEDEVRDFFTKKHGDCIEAIHMQEVSAEGQPLYARLVVNPPAVIHNILEGLSKAKFTINGKHVWARKYVRKVNPKSASPSKSPPSSPQTASPPSSSN